MESISCTNTGLLSAKEAPKLDKQTALRIYKSTLSLLATGISVSQQVTPEDTTVSATVSCRKCNVF